MSVREVRSLLRKYNVRLSRRKGQSLLVNPRIVSREISYAEIGRDDVVVEVGAGLGTLTRALAEKAGKVYAIELDKRLVAILEDRLSHFDNVEIIHGDALEVDFPPFNKIVSNPPYSISAPLILKIAPLKFERAVLTFQLEFAERLVAKPGSKQYGRLSVSVQHYLNTKILEKIGRENFFPPPKVDSAIVLLTPRPSPPRINSTFLSDITRQLFTTPNKKVRHRVFRILEKLDVPKDGISRLVERCPIAEKRVRQLTPKEVEDLASWIWRLIDERKKD
nr:16S rRNA (adenine(1518)-N(6)/adenine(1519)-N(6))-dimethyltransferase RsmA [Candidatus Freyrarchaeum guaymaensis]HDO81211.1 ribosomal RNA small subunit methyltransferase A [Candidatus Bathyarchaeota archaeon]